MWIVLFLHYTYRLDFFVNGDSYLRTTDVCHGHFGYYLGWPVWQRLRTSTQFNVSILLVTQSIYLTLKLQLCLHSAREAMPSSVPQTINKTSFAPPTVRAIIGADKPSICGARTRWRIVENTNLSYYAQACGGFHAMPIIWGI